MEEYKQVIILRRDLKMSAGKAAAQAVHAAVTALEEARRHYPRWVEEWFKQGQKVVVLGVNSLNELLNLKNKAEELKLPAALIVDAGRTELKSGTITAVGIGPAPSRIIDLITGKLKLY